jgi:hypothetical protein
MRCVLLIPMSANVTSIFFPACSPKSDSVKSAFLLLHDEEPYNALRDRGRNEVCGKVKDRIRSSNGWSGKFHQ